MTACEPAGTVSDETFADLWRRAAAAHRAQPFLLFEAGDGKVSTWTYGEIDDRVDRAADALRRWGVQRGDPVHLALANSPAFVVLWLAVARLGAWMVPADPQATSRDLALQMNRVHPVVGVCSARREGVYRDAAPDDLTVVVLEETADDLAEDAPLMSAPILVEPSPQACPADRLAVMWTSGTTSAPKGVILTQRNYAHVARVMAQAVSLSRQHRWLVALPLFHANAQYYCFAAAIHVGASVALTATFSASRWVESARALSVTHASLFAAPVRMILARTPSGTPPLALTHVWFAQNLGAGHYREFSQLVGTLPRQLYGMTETVAIVTADDGDPARHDVIGRPVAGRVVGLIDPATGLEPTPGEPGMINVLGRRGVDLFAGYLDDPMTTERSFVREGDREWFSTGDLATRDETGRLHFVGRVDDVIKVSGENVSLTEVEAILAHAPGVLEVAVVARPDPVRDHVPVAFVVPRDRQAPPNLEMLSAWASEELSPASRPREWILIEELPRTSVGKVRRFALDTAPTVATGQVTGGAAEDTQHPS